MNTSLAYSWFVCLTGLLACGAVAAQERNSTDRGKIIAIVAGEAISEDQLSSSWKGQLQRIRQQEFELKRKGLDELIRHTLLEMEAKKKGITTEKLLQTEIDKKVADPTPGELWAYYLAQKQNISQPFEDVEASLRESLKLAKIQAARDAYLKNIQQKADIVSLLRPPQLDIKYDPQRLKGNPNAPVIIVEFSDFTCPFCRQAESTLNNLIAKYRGKVSLAYRDFPLAEIHPQAQLAAEASRCAAEQGKFWQFHDFLFTASHISDKESLFQAAANMGVDEPRFDSCLSSNRYSPQIEEDVQDATSAGVSGTPGFFINGIFLAGLQPESAFEKIINDELDTLKSKNQLPGEARFHVVKSLLSTTASHADYLHKATVLRLSEMLWVASLCLATIWLAVRIRRMQSAGNGILRVFASRARGILPGNIWGPKHADEIVRGPSSSGHN